MNVWIWQRLSNVLYNFENFFQKKIFFVVKEINTFIQACIKLIKTMEAHRIKNKK